MNTQSSTRENLPTTLSQRDEIWTRLNREIDDLVVQRDNAPAEDRKFWQRQVDLAVDNFESTMDGLGG